MDTTLQLPAVIHHLVVVFHECLEYIAQYVIYVYIYWIS